MARLDPKNLTAQLRYRAAGNPPSSKPDSVISNCFPGLEFDFRNLWKNIFEGIELHEADNFVVASPGHPALLNRWLVRVAGESMLVPLEGPRRPDGATRGLNDLVAMEWSNALAAVLHRHAGKFVTCEFANTVQRPGPKVLRRGQPLLRVRLRIRPVFAWSELLQGRLPVIDAALVAPGQLTQSLCSPWQNDFKECACFYWASSRPDFVNVELGADGVSRGNDWFDRNRAQKRQADAPVTESEVFDYVDLFRNWQGFLHFVLGGKDVAK